MPEDDERVFETDLSEPSRRDAMSYCSSCRHPVGDEGRFCGNCGKSVWEDEPAASGPDNVPWWLGWLAFPIGYLTYVFGIVPYSYWAYRRGRRDGVGREPIDQPDPNFGNKAIGWGLLTLLTIIVPFLGLYVFIHLPTICYKQGVKIGAKEGTASERFTSLPAFSGVFTGIIIAAIFLIASLAVVIAEGDDSSESIFESIEPIQVAVPTIEAPTYPRPISTPIPSGPRLTGAEAAGKASALVKRGIAESGRRDLSAFCEYEDYNSRTREWIVLCIVVGPQNAMEIRLTVDDQTGTVSDFY